MAPRYSTRLRGQANRDQYDQASAEAGNWAAPTPNYIHQPGVNMSAMNAMSRPGGGYVPRRNDNGDWARAQNVAQGWASLDQRADEAAVSDQLKWEQLGLQKELLAHNQALGDDRFNWAKQIDTAKLGQSAQRIMNEWAVEQGKLGQGDQKILNAWAMANKNYDLREKEADAKINDKKWQSMYGARNAGWANSKASYESMDPDMLNVNPEITKGDRLKMLEAGIPGDAIDRAAEAGNWAGLQKPQNGGRYAARKPILEGAILTQAGITQESAPELFDKKTGRLSPVGAQYVDTVNQHWVNGAQTLDDAIRATETAMFGAEDTSGAEADARASGGFGNNMRDLALWGASRMLGLDRAIGAARSVRSAWGEPRQSAQEQPASAAPSGVEQSMSGGGSSGTDSGASQQQSSAGQNTFQGDKNTDTVYAVQDALGRNLTAGEAQFVLRNAMSGMPVAAILNALAKNN